MKLLLTPERLAEIKERCAKATPGPWKVDEQRRPYSETTRTLVPFTREDVEFNINNRMDVPDAIADIETLQERVRELENTLHDVVGVCEGYLPDNLQEKTNEVLNKK